MDYQKQVLENGPGGLKVIDTVPAGEKRSLFDLSASGSIFSNPRPVTVEIVEIVVYCTSDGSFSLSSGPNLADASAVTPVYPLKANEGYIDAGFLLAAGSQIFLNVSSGSFVGHVLWRYA